MTLCNHGGLYWLGLANHIVPITKLFLSEGSTIIHYVVLVLLMITNADTKDHYSPCSMFWKKKKRLFYLTVWNRERVAANLSSRAAGQLVGAGLESVCFNVWFIQSNCNWSWNSLFVLSCRHLKKPSGWANLASSIETNLTLQDVCSAKSNFVWCQLLFFFFSFL